MRTATLPLLVLALAACLPAQGKGTDKHKDDAASAKAAKVEPVKDDATTAKDRVIKEIDRFRKAKVSTKAKDWRAHLPEPPLQTFDPAHQYRWHLDTSVGPLVVTLLPEAAPKHVTSVIYLSRCGFYDGLLIPRIEKGFMAQSGSPTNDRMGDAGYKIDGEFAAGVKHDKPGALSAANDGKNGPDGSQFFLTFVATPHLDGKHTVHGFVTEGMDTLQALEAKGVEKPNDPLPEKVTIVRTWISVVDAPKPDAPKPDAPKPEPPKEPGK